MIKFQLFCRHINLKKISGESVKSVLEQSYKNIELIVVENGPKDKTERIISELNCDNKILYVYNEEPNVSRARNIGLKKATGKYIAFIDSDDKYEKDFLEKMIGKIKKEKTQLVTCGYKKKCLTGKMKSISVKDSSRIENTEDLQEYLQELKENDLFNELWNKIYVADIIKRNNILFDENIDLGEDLIFNIDYLKYINKATYVNETLYVYTEGEEGLKLKKRGSRFKIEYSLTKYLKKYYLEKNYKLEYTYKRIAWVYCRGVVEIFDKKDNENKEQKDKKLKEFINSEQYNADLLFIKDKISDKKIKFIVKYFLLKGEYRIKLFVLMNKIRNILKR